MTTDVKGQKSRKVAVLGPIPCDQIVTDDGERFEKYGCALYTAVALSALLGAGDTIVPISHVHRKDEGPIKEILAPFPNIDTSGITSAADRGDRVELRYSGPNRRAERQTSFMDPILPGDVAGVGGLVRPLPQPGDVGFVQRDGGDGVGVVADAPRVDADLAVADGGESKATGGRGDHARSPS